MSVSRELKAGRKGQVDVRLPDFMNLGVLLRSALIAEGAHVVFALAAANKSLGEAFWGVLNSSGIYEFVLLSVLFVLFGFSNKLKRLPYHQGCLAIILVCLSVTVAWYAVLGEMQYFVWWREGLLAILLPALILWYFNWRYHVLSPALSEARLMALQARIRPHFLFNSLNTVLGLIRNEPKRAERVLENLAELYRALLSEAGTLAPLARELDLARGYAEIEMMRLGERLKVSWQCQDSALDALVPPLMLQPLLENAVYHGVEPSESGGEVSVAIFLKGDQLNMVMRNPCLSTTHRHGGNRMALENIRERLALHFDAEAEMSTYKAGEEFVVQIRMPYRHG